MALREILTEPNKTLRQKSLKVEKVDEDLQRLMNDMTETMYAAPGIGLAAPQVGILRRIFVMDCSDDKEGPGPLVLINPEIVWASEHKTKYEEGCLSIPDFFAELERSAEVRIKCIDENEEKREHHFVGLWAICAQHEIDHLNGVLFLDYLRPMRRAIITSKLRKIKREKLKKASQEGK